MQGKKPFLDKEVTHFRLSERVPRHNLYRRLAELVDWSFLYDETRTLYSHTGQPSLDPVVFFKLVLVGRLENLVSDRRLVEHCALRLDILLFLGYEVDEELPWHSTVSRTRQLFPAAVFERLFDHVFAQCVARGLVAGDTQAVDSAPVKANASLETVLEKRTTGVKSPFLATDEAATAPAASVVTAPAHQLRNLAAHQARLATHSSVPGAQHEKARLLSNKTHYSPTDPDARISIKPGKARALNYLCSLAVDTAKGVISHVQADFADSRDSLHLPRLLTGLQQRLRSQQLRMQELLADAGYANGTNYALLEAQQVTAWIPVFGRYKAAIEGFTYRASTDDYTCAAGKVLSFRKYDTSADGTGLKIYWATCSDCQQCPLKPTCVPGAKRKQLTRTLYDEPYRRAWQRQQSRRGQHMRRVRQGTVEPVFGNLLHHYGLRRMNVRGQAGAHKTMLLTAVAYNLKKLLKYRPNRQVSLTMALPQPLLAAARR
ncbi:IS1182 family transposase [Hymenobacter sp. J193]|uniref:IS1182 family transposase n=1 Tax=Hymenobacter sp. J193 TaxID=2898429 RepID=UPI00215077E9|nr:IS1182 family transposase [Hymenobacter sp. J193]MCR5886205.1 IS1182 family transposase [Hymenobacter sp. J193]MCR5886820.1 IS1182 family transposase [Hymenobacter sp. J193]MCR5887113.1 IS1182 family transposase [Hymenobacter sp. J193]MCR5889893.1 IS1182 family transposase [Hymenobacter sp. J193]MCR5890232.1 IS1182 family transposase [Hymenobacter sp. J193]